MKRYFCHRDEGFLPNGVLFQTIICFLYEEFGSEAKTIKALEDDYYYLKKQPVYKPESKFKHDQEKMELINIIECLSPDNLKLVKNFASKIFC